MENKDKYDNLYKPNIKTENWYNKPTNKSTILRAKKDKDHPYSTIPSFIFNGNYDYCEIAIYNFLSSHKDNFVIIKDWTRKQLKMPKNKFEKAWKSLENKGHILMKRGFKHWEILFSEDPIEYNTLTTDRKSTDRKSTDEQCIDNSQNSDKNNTLTTDRKSIYRKSTDGELTITKKTNTKETTLDLKTKEGNLQNENVDDVEGAETDISNGINPVYSTSDAATQAPTKDIDIFFKINEKDLDFSLAIDDMLGDVDDPYVENIKQK